MDGRLNIFQKGMLHWDDVYPYNVVHAVRMREPLDLERLKKAINGVLETRGLTGLTLDRRRGLYHYYGGPGTCEIKVLAGGDDPQAGLSAEIEKQLNTRFVLTERFTPFRFFVLTERDTFWLGFVYFHAVADATSIVWLVREMVEVYLKGEGSQQSEPMNLYPEKRDALSVPGMFLRKLMAMPSILQDTRQTGRLSYQDALDFTNRFTYLSLDAGQLKSLLRVAKKWEVTFNDLFLSLLMKGLSHVRPPDNPKRRKISIGCIVNLRKDLGLAGQRLFGLFLGSFVVVREVPEEMPLMELAKNIRQQTLANKQQRLYMGTSLEMVLGRFLLSWYSKKQQRKMYRKFYPLWGGITNLNLNALWPQAPVAEPMDYLRAISTGPVTPLVLSVTTRGKSAQLGITVRSTVFSEAEVERLSTVFLEMLKQLQD
jgi:hypothetical protein